MSNMEKLCMHIVNNLMVCKRLYIASDSDSDRSLISFSLDKALIASSKNSFIVYFPFDKCATIDIKPTWAILGSIQLKVWNDCLPDTTLDTGQKAWKIFGVGVSLASQQPSTEAPCPNIANSQVSSYLDRHRARLSFLALFLSIDRTTWEFGSHIRCLCADREFIGQGWVRYSCLEPLLPFRIKTRGFCLEVTHFTEAQRLRKIVALLTLALCWAMRTGLFLHQLKPIVLKNHGRRARSLFRLSWDHLRHLALNPSSHNDNDCLQSLNFLSCT